MAMMLGKNVFYEPKDKKQIDKKYRKLNVDKQPIIETIEKLDYKKLLKEYLELNGKELKPVKPRNGKKKVPSNIYCPKCNAPHNYLYDNSGGRGQYKCKVCNTNFNDKNRFSKSIILRCPYCQKVLDKIKNRKNFDIYKCRNNNCSYYIKNINSMSKEEKDLFKKQPGNFKVRYIYRTFNFDFKPLSKDSPVSTKVNLSNIYCSPHTLGLILTYHVNYGISSRRTAALMKDVHGLNISHQTVLNYANTVGTMVKPFIDGYDYDLSGCYCGDETYIKINGKWNYIFYFFDSKKKIILSYRVSKNRDTETAIKALDDALSKMKTIPKGLEFIVDGNPIYLLAQHFFAEHGINFTVKQVIGLTNEDPVSKAYRPLKQIIERLNRTFKGNYHSTNGFKSDKGAEAFVNLFVAYFNFLRPHSSIEKRVPVVLEELEKLPHMPARWSKLINLSQEYILSNQVS